MAFHLRYSVNGKPQAIEIAKAFVKKFNPSKYIFCYEVKDDNKHVHARLEYVTEPKKQTRSDFFKQFDMPAKYYHKEETDKLKNELYVTKDLDFILSNYSDDELDELVQRNKVINEDKKKDIKLKLVDYFKENGAGDLNDMCHEIVSLYVDEWDKLPPARHLIMAYAVYVSKKLNVNQNHIKDYYTSFF